jgi:Bacterial Ig-like domain
MRLLLLLPLLLLVAPSCLDTPAGDGEGGDDGGGDSPGADGGGGGTGDGGGSGDGGGGGCQVEVDSTWPTAGATDAAVTTNIEWNLSDDDPSASASLRDGDGALVPGVSSWDSGHQRVTFDPDGALSPSSSYRAELEYCAGTAEFSFVTFAMGGPVDPETIVGGAYVLDFYSGRISEPAGVGELLLAQLDALPILAVDSVDGVSIMLSGGTSDSHGRAQDTCLPTLSFPNGDYSAAPTFSAGPQDTTLGASTVIPLTQVTVSGTFAADGESIGGVHTSGEIDARQLTTSLGDMLGTDDPAVVCDLFAGFGATCAPCASDGASYCLPVDADAMTATRLAEPLVVVDQANCHPDCAASVDNPDCDRSGW